MPDTEVPQRLAQTLCRDPRTVEGVPNQGGGRARLWGKQESQGHGSSAQRAGDAGEAGRLDRGEAWDINDVAGWQERELECEADGTA